MNTALEYFFDFIERMAYLCIAVSVMLFALTYIDNFVKHIICGIMILWIFKISIFKTKGGIK